MSNNTTDTSRPSIKADNRPEDFMYSFKAHGVRVEKPLHSMTDEELAKIYRSVGGRINKYDKIIENTKSKLKNLEEVLNNVYLTSKSRGLDIDKETRELEKKIKQK